MQRYSAFSLLRHALSDHQRWRPAWRKAEPKPSYDVVIVGAGGHGLASAYYLASKHKVKSIAVLEKGWLGGGNTARNTTIVRSNYLRPESIALYELSRRLYETLSIRLNFNVMFSPRGVVNLCLTRRELDTFARIAAANRARRVDARIISPKRVRRLLPLLNDSPDMRYPILGAYWQPRGGVARHDAVAWAFARAADSFGVDIVEGCEVEGIIVENGTAKGVETRRGRIRAEKVALATAGHTSMLAATAGLRLPLESVCLQAFVSEPLKPVLDRVVMAGAVHGYASQSDKGELVIGGAADPYLNYSQRGSWPAIEDTVAAMIELFPAFSRLRLLRSWGGIVDMTPDRSPLIGRTPVRGLYLNCGWGTGGFKAIPGSGLVFAATLAADSPHPIAAPFELDRFVTGRLLPESAAAAVAH